MKYLGLSLLFLASVVFGCASGSFGLRTTDQTVDVSLIESKDVITADNAESVLQKYVIDFEIPNPLYTGLDNSSRRNDPSHEPTLVCKGALLTDYSTEAHILFRCLSDSISREQWDSFKEKYFEEHVVDGSFRILITMESGFSDKSMDPDLWAFYIESAHGVMVEPSEIRVTTVTSAADSLYSQYKRAYFPRRLMKRSITLYFKKKTFFGQDMISPENPSIILVISREQKVVARIGWKVVPSSPGSGETDEKHQSVK